MIPILYENNETEFTSNGLGRLYDCISCIVTEERNGIYECDFEYPITGLNFDEIYPGRIIGCEHDTTGDVQPFDIVSYSRPTNGIVTFHAVHISYRLSGVTVTGSNINSLSEAFDLFSNATPTNPFLYYSDFGDVGYFAAADGVPHSVRQMLGGIEGSILDSYGGEYEFDKFIVKLWKSRGTEKPLSIRYGVNLLDYNEETDYSETYNSVVPYWTGNDDSGNTIVVKGERVDSGAALYNGRTDCVPLDLTDKFETRPTAQQLQTMAALLMELENTNLPSRSITVDFVRLQDTSEYRELAGLMDCGLCDSVQLIFPRYNVEGTYKIVKIVYNVLLERYDSVELGNLSASLASALGISKTGTFSGGGSGGGGGSLPGVIQMFGSDVAPPGWLICDGSAVSRSTYARLFSIIGTTFGAGDGSTTFNVPDLKNRFPVGIGDEYNLNSKGGSKYIQAHKHAVETQPTFTIPNHQHSLQRQQLGITTGSTNRYFASGTTVGGNTANDGGGGGCNRTKDVAVGAVSNLPSGQTTGDSGNLPPYIGINFIICTGE